MVSTETSSTPLLLERFGGCGVKLTYRMLPLARSESLNLISRRETRAIGDFGAAGKTELLSPQTS